MEDTKTHVPNTQMSSTKLVSVQLSEDIIEEILKRLPVKLLVKFKCVCKAWHRLLTNPIFTNKHLRFNSTTHIILSCKSNPHLSLSLPLNPNPNVVFSPQQLGFPFVHCDCTSYFIKGHCDGLLCIVTLLNYIIVWNPSIQWYRLLPTPNFMSLNQILGIGYDSSINNYKIVKAHYCHIRRINGYPPPIEILSLNSNSWREISDADTPSYWMENYDQSLSLNGSIYWLALDMCRCQSMEILRFDLSKEKFSQIPYPSRDTKITLWWLGEINQLLCTFYCEEQSHFDIWVTQDDLNWEKLITISMIVDPVLHPSCYAPLCFIETGELLMSVRGYGLVSYDPKDQSYRRLALTEEATWLRETCYRESLVSPQEPLDETASSSRQMVFPHEPLNQTSSSSGALRKMWLRFSNMFLSHFSCHCKARKRL